MVSIVIRDAHKKAAFSIKLTIIDSPIDMPFELIHPSQTVAWQMNAYPETLLLTCTCIVTHFGLDFIELMAVVEFLIYVFEN